MINMEGKIFGRLIVLDKYKNVEKNRKRIHWLCRCECGNEKYIDGTSLRLNHTTSCGCLIETHGMSKTKLYSVFYNMKDRCYNSKSKPYKNYGKRGISICDEWMNKEDGFIVFYNWSLDNGYKEGLAIDRIENDGNYESSNCQWITLEENTAKSNKVSLRNVSKKESWALSPDNKKYTFYNASQFGREHNLNGKGIRKTLKGLLKTYKKWKFGYIEEVYNEIQ